MTGVAVTALTSAFLTLASVNGIDAPQPEEVHTTARSGPCYTVSFQVVLVNSDLPQSTGSITGDLEGTVAFTVTGFTWPPTGVTNTATFEFTWNITGGVIPELIGESFVTSVENRNILFFLLPPARQTSIQTGSHRALSGVERANLTYTGETPIVQPQITTLDHHGVICT